jgi:polyisoprenyl-teichoic acid--peptidoglycan teichoic acid transferase
VTAKDVFTYFLACLVVFAGLAGMYDGVAVSAGGDTAPQSAQASSNLSAMPPPFQGISRLHLVLIGADDRKGEVGRSDTLMVVWINPARKKAAIMSIPRDLKATIPGRGTTKINAAYAYGGADLTRKTVEALLGQPTDGYVKVNFESFIKAMEVMGGVYIDVPDVEGQGRGMNYDDNWGNLHIHLRPGYQYLTGRQAIGFVRYRKSNIHGLGDGDFKRAERQQLFLKAMVQQHLKVQNLPATLKAARALMSCFETDLSWRQVIDLARLLKSMNIADIKSVTIPAVDAMQGGVYYALLTEDKFREVLDEVDAHLSGTGGATTCQVAVLNGTNKAGLGQQAAAALTAAGFKVVSVGNAATTDTPYTSIRYQPASEPAAQAAALALGTGMPEAAPETVASSQAKVSPLEIIIGQDFTGPPPTTTRSP